MNSIEDALKFPIHRFTKKDGSINRRKVLTLDPEHRQQALNFIFICKSIEVHGRFFNYARTKFTRTDLLVEIWCPDHQGYFKQQARVHMNGHGCPKCAHKIISRETEYGTFDVPASMHQYRIEGNKIIWFNKTNTKEFEL
ncbi:hypothetical protein My1_026 [Pectobacterium phage My1]|uniref:Uncharacterized protein n=1 Tax=Pectobacterium phage My1 TaxID=1204539 RepID=J9QGQ2_9CAUD|nr:hypothetical protein My1_026 [Pectobacterium phage My1]AFQ22185.1 hypothetical protein My1_026 [Pectobacterium phage My1]